MGVAAQIDTGVVGASLRISEKMMEERFDRVWNMAKLPVAYARKGPRRLEDVATGETVFIGAFAMFVDAEMNCFLNPRAVVAGENGKEDERFPRLRVYRDSNGHYHVAILAPCNWEPGDPALSWSTTVKKDWYPVASITEAAQQEEHEQ